MEEIIQTAREEDPYFHTISNTGLLIPAKLDHSLNMVDHVQTMVETWLMNVFDHVSNINVKMATIV